MLFLACDGLVDTPDTVMCDCAPRVVVVTDDMLRCAVCGACEGRDFFVEQDTSAMTGTGIRTAEDGTVVNRFASCARVRTVNKRARDTVHELHRLRSLVAIVSLGGGAMTPAPSAAVTPPAPLRQPAAVRPPRRKCQPPASVMDSMQTFTLVESAEPRRSHRCGAYALSVHLRRLYRDLGDARPLASAVLCFDLETLVNQRDVSPDAAAKWAAFVAAMRAQGDDTCIPDNVVLRCVALRVMDGAPRNPPHCSELQRCLADSLFAHYLTGP
jgi:hypothetical protein